MYEGIPGGKQVQHYAAMITRTDQMVGKILDTLSELQLDKDTIFSTRQTTDQMHHL